jgi:4-hydroxy-3-polyprenylbenzoate decarboxylase
MFMKGPLDVLDHASDTFSFGGKMGIDATVKMKEEITKPPRVYTPADSSIYSAIDKTVSAGIAINANVELLQKSIPVVIFSVNRAADSEIIKKLILRLKSETVATLFGLVIAVDSAINPNDIFTVAWQTLANSDPLRDHEFIGDNTLFIDGTAKVFRQGGFPRRWPNVVCSDDDTIKTVDDKWSSLELGDFLPSPSLQLRLLKHRGKDEIFTTIQ